ncbi:MAG: hypothetical protein Q4D31_03270 [Eubacteriales bacterium]|nr:hypothetical protein [Eubacteriales bacterium]
MMLVRHRDRSPLDAVKKEAFPGIFAFYYRRKKAVPQGDGGKKPAEYGHFPQKPSAETTPIERKEPSWWVENVSSPFISPDLKHHGAIIRDNF